jgi:hypothetical protein
MSRYACRTVAWNFRRVSHVLVDAILGAALHSPILAVWGAALSAITAVWVHLRSQDPCWVYAASGAFGAFSVMAIVGSVAQQLKQREAARVRPQVIASSVHGPVFPASTFPVPASRVVNAPAPVTTPPRTPRPGTSDLTPIEIWQQIESLPLPQREAVAKSYLGLVVEWEVEVASASSSPSLDGRILLQLRYGSVDKPLWAKLSPTPGAGLLYRGERGVVTGTIAAVTTRDIDLDPAEFSLARRAP